MATDLIGATDEMLSLVDVAWAAYAPTIAGGGPCPLQIEFSDGDAEPPNNPEKLPWARVTIRHAGVWEFGIARHTSQHFGTLFLNIFAPQARYEDEERTSTIAQMLASMMYDALAAHRGQVELINIRLTEGGFDGPYYGYNVLADFQWNKSTR